MAYIMV